MATLAERWIEEGVQKGIENGMVLEAISSRFDSVPENIITLINFLGGSLLS